MQSTSEHQQTVEVGEGMFVPRKDHNRSPQENYPLVFPGMGSCIGIVALMPEGTLAVHLETQSEVSIGFRTEEEQAQHVQKLTTIIRQARKQSRTPVAIHIVSPRIVQYVGDPGEKLAVRYVQLLKQHLSHPPPAVPFTIKRHRYPEAINHAKQRHNIIVQPSENPASARIEIVPAWAREADHAHMHENSISGDNKKWYPGMTEEKERIP